MTFYPDKSTENKTEYHGHPAYLKVYIMLLVLFGLSLIAAYIGHTTIAIVLIFGIAASKAWLVMANFMHLKFEPKLIYILPFFGITILIVLFFFVLPDIREGIPIVLAR